MRRCALAFTLITISMLGTAQAQVGTSPPSATVLTLRETAEITVPPDVLVVSMRAESHNRSAIVAQQSVNALMAKALAKIKGAGDGVITATTGGYSVFETQDGADVTSRVWQASQVLTLTTKSFDFALGLVDNLQHDGLLISSMEFELSPDLRRTTQTRLVQDAIAQLRTQAEAAAGALAMHATGYRTVRLEKETISRHPMRAVAMVAKASAPPSAAAPDLPVQVTVEAEVQLAPLP
jgi:predicted secreted protein